MKKLSILAFAAVLAACSGNNKAGETTATADSVSAPQDTAAAVATAEEEQPQNALPVSREEALKAWSTFADYMDGVKPDSYLCHDIDGDGTPEVFLANRKVKDGDARAAFTVADGKLKVITNTVYLTPSAAKYEYYVADGYLLTVIENKGVESTSYILKNSKVARIAYNSLLIVGWDEEKDKPIYEFGEEGQPMIGKDFDHLEPSDEAKKYLNPKGLKEINSLDGWQEL